ncbi:MAG TPA: Stk1 family PASTA domain-containing Ser/Thr kinase [Bacillota bacterium]|nr:Stk1 family PASTA domain-containing Ser/Thr kinase [Bacillota bacterium]
MGSRILAGRYELIEKIGEGGMAVVFKSRDRLLNRYVAIKILRPEYTKDESFIDSFRRESQIAANLVHPNIVNVYDVGKEGNIYFIVMELIDGQPLSEIIKKEAPLEPRRAATIAKQVASALSMAHKHQLIHRDVKPHNILITSDGVAKMSDFGIAKAVTSDTFVGEGTEAIMGSVHYFSPEQARGSYVDEKSDIYSLGIVLYEMLTGKVPFDGDTAVAVAVKHMNEPMLPPAKLNAEIPEGLEEIVLKATSKLQMNRYRSADDLITALNFVKFSKHADPAAAAAAAAARGRSKDTLAEMSEEDYARRLEAATPESLLKDEGEARKRREKRDDRRDSKNDDEDDEEDDIDYEDDVFHPYRTLMLIIGLIVALFVGNYVVSLYQNVSREMNVPTHEVPLLEGKKYDEAREMLAEMNISLTIEMQLQSEKYAAGVIMSQSPIAGSSVKEGQTVKVTVSSGGKPSGVAPNLLEMSLTKAIRTIESYGYVFGGSTEEYNEEVAKGLVISQNPAVGSEMADGGIITLVVSLGSENAEEVGVDLIGMNLDDALYRLKDLGYERGDVNSVVSATIPRGVIISTNPGPGVEIEEGVKVDIVVSMGSDVTLGPVEVIDPDAPIEPVVPDVPDNSDGDTSDPDNPDGDGVVTENPENPDETNPDKPPLYSVAIYVDFSNASQDSFEMVVHVNDGINTSSSTPLGVKNKSDGGELITVYGSGSDGKVVVMYGNEMAYEYGVDFEKQVYYVNYTGNNW